jgi:hypothetical protein
VDPRPTREEAARVLGISAAASAGDVKRAYRQLVRDHHPDAGGDPETFQRVQTAYERLAVAADDEPPLVARGRPSRRPAPFTTAGAGLDLTRIDWDAPLPDEGEPLGVDSLARWLAGDGALRAVDATSRAPGSRLNRVARHLATELTSTLRLRPSAPPGDAVVIELVAATRRARRSLEHISAEDGWVRTRGSSTTTLRTTVGPGPSVRTTALLAAVAADELLERLGWPLGSWSADLTVDAR